MQDMPQHCMLNTGTFWILFDRKTALVYKSCSKCSSVFPAVGWLTAKWCCCRLISTTLSPGLHHSVPALKPEATAAADWAHLWRNLFFPHFAHQLWRRCHFQRTAVHRSAPRLINREQSRSATGVTAPELPSRVMESANRTASVRILRLH